MNDKIKRSIISILLFIIVFWGSGQSIIMGSAVYDIVARSIQLLAAILAAGCYWIGSNK